MTGRRVCLLVIVILASAALAPNALAGYAIQPADGLTVTSRSPTFLVYIDSGDSLPQVEVSTSPDHNDFGFTGGYVGSCVPTTPFGEPYKFTCQLPSFETPLAPGTYYWAYTYEHNVCTTLYDFPYCGLQSQFSGPFKFTVAEPVAPPGAGLVSPEDGAVVGSNPTLVVSAPAGADMEFYVSDSATRLDDGTPAGLTAFSCTGTAASTGNYTCSPASPYDLTVGTTYYWWAILNVDGTRWIYGPRTFTVRAGSAPGTGGGGSGNNGPHVVTDANELPRSSHYTGRSIYDIRLSAASYWMTKAAGAPKKIAVACWNPTDWPGISGDSGDGIFATYGLYLPYMPHWVHLSPATCRGIETLLYHRPRVPNRIIAFAVDTVTHEMIHALGIRSEAQTECYAMQVSIIMALRLRVPLAYSQRLARLNLDNYLRHPARYIDTTRCRENGAWDLQPNKPSPPWHYLTLRR